MIKADFGNVFQTKTFEVTESNVIQCSLNLTEENENKILSLTGNILHGDETGEEEYLVYGGLATFNAVFTADELTRIEVGTKFTFKTKKPSDTCTLKRVWYKLSGVRVKKDSGMLYAEATLTTTITFAETEEKTYLKSCDALCKCGNIPLLTSSEFSASVDLEDEFTVKKIKRVLMSDASIAVNKVECGAGVVRAFGQAYLSVVMLPFGDNADIIKEYRAIPFDYEVDCDLSGEDCVAGACATLTKLNLKVYQDEENSSSNVTAAISFTILGTCQKKTDEAFVEDCYSTACELNLTHSDCSDNMLLSQRYVQEKVFGKAYGDVPEYSRLSSLVGQRIEVTESFVEDDKLTLKGVIFVNGIFIGSENEFIRSDFSLPFASDIGMTGDGFDNLQVVLEDLTYKLRSGKIEAEAVLGISFTESEKSAYNFISAIEEGEAKLPESAAISVYSGQKGDTSWDVTKFLGLSEEEILKFNPNIVFPLAGGEKIIVFRQR